MLNKVALFLVGILGFLPSTYAGPSITWGWFSAAPYMITDGPDAGQGIFDLIRSKLKDRLPRYEHKQVLAPFPRIFDEIKHGQEWCFVGGVKNPEREAIAYFSLPVAVFLPFRVIVHRDSRANLAGTQSLQRLLENRDLRTSVLKGRSHSPIIDGLLRQHGHVQTHSEFNEAARMLLADRLDYLIEIPLISSFQLREIDTHNELVYLPIQESSEHVFNRVMCAKTAWGQQVIDDVNTILRTERTKPAYRQIVEKWSDEQSVKQLQELYDSEFLKAR